VPGAIRRVVVARDARIVLRDPFGLANRWLGAWIAPAPAPFVRLTQLNCVMTRARSLMHLAQMGLASRAMPPRHPESGTFVATQTP
jgi:hypothetical protein